MRHERKGEPRPNEPDMFRAGESPNNDEASLRQPGRLSSGNDFPHAPQAAANMLSPGLVREARDQHCGSRFPRTTLGNLLGCALAVTSGDPTLARFIVSVMSEEELNEWAASSFPMEPAPLPEELLHDPQAYARKAVQRVRSRQRQSRDVEGKSQ
jgi:hypothetical protein